MKEKKKVNKILIILPIIIVAVLVGAILGIQFMTAGIDKKVEVKQALFPYIVSCVVMFGAFGIWKLMVMILNGI